MKDTKIEIEAAAATILLKAARLIETKGWVQGAIATDSNGLGVPSYHPDAISFCALGALNRTLSDFKRVCVIATECNVMGFGHAHALQTVQAAIESLAIPHWNDEKGRTREDVIDLLVAAAWNVGDLT